MSGIGIYGTQYRMTALLSSISGSTTSAAAPVANLLLPEPSNLCIFLGTSAYVELGFTSAIDVTLLAILFTNLTATGTRRWRGAASQAALTAAPGYDSTAQTGWLADAGLINRKMRKHDMLYLGSDHGNGGPGAQSYAWWRLDLEDVNAPDSEIRVGNIVIDAAWVPNINATFGGGIGMNDPAIKNPTTEGQLQPVLRPRRLTQRIPLDFQSEADMYGFAMTLDQQVGISTPLLYCREFAPTTFRQSKIIFGTQDAIGGINDSALDIYSKTYELTEMAA